MAVLERAKGRRKGDVEKNEAGGGEERGTAKMYFTERDYFSARVYPVEFHGHPA